MGRRGWFLPGQRRELPLFPSSSKTLKNGNVCCHISFDTIVVSTYFSILGRQAKGRPQGIFLCLESLWGIHVVELPPGMLRTVAGTVALRPEIQEFKPPGPLDNGR